ncbi:MAG: hypothetical protein SynsKO_41200 [Synoicihabitans sp.]
MPFSDGSPHMNPEDIDGPLAVALAFQAVLLLAGIALLVRLIFSAWGKAFWKRSSPLTPWDISGSDFAFAMVLVIAMGVGGNFCGQALATSFGGNPELALVFQGAGFQLGLLLGAILAAFNARQKQIITSGGATPRAATPLPINPWIGGAFALLAAFPVLTAINLVWTNALTTLGFETTHQEVVEIFSKLELPAARYGMMVLAVIVAPIVEEVIFRAGLFRFMRTRFPRWLAFGFPAAFFALMHGNLVAFGPLFALGVVFAIAYERTGRIMVPIFAHALFNLNTLGLLLAGVEV